MALENNLLSWAGSTQEENELLLEYTADFKYYKYVTDSADEKAGKTNETLKLPKEII